MSMQTWEIDLYVEGPVSVRNRIRTEQQKGFRVDDPFYSTIRIEGRPTMGLHATVTARAESLTSAENAAMVFFGHMLDALALTVNQPMILSLAERDRVSRQRYGSRRVLEESEIIDAFKEAHFLRTGSPLFLRALGWYRKGRFTEDPFDAFLALWNSIELVASKFHQYVPSIDQERAKNGSVSQIWECFKALWGECTVWPTIGGDAHWIDSANSTRNDVAHARKPVTVEQVEIIARQIPVLSEVAYRFLVDWRMRFLELDRHPPSEWLRSN